jgi:hypothetical protein
MADDERAPEVAAEITAWLEVEPLDDVTRRRLVASALHETESVDAPASAAATARPSRAWRWIAAAAALVIVAAGTLAVITASGGHDDKQQAAGDRSTALAPKAVSAAPNLGGFGNLDDPANLAALRAALKANSFAASSAPPEAAADATTSAQGATAGNRAPLSLCGAVVPEGGSILAQATGTIDGRHATVVLIEKADGTRASDAVLEDPCELRHLP